MSEAPKSTPSPGYDTSEPRARTIALFGAVTLVLLVVIILGLQAYVDYAREKQIFVKQLEPVSEDLRQLRAREEAELNSYAYLDREKGLVRLPVRRAMELLIREKESKNAR